ncbi:MAG TPA: hypothetical protein VHT97_09280, partial [Acidimicrobiales bacterium]|nr:hypothetical protein [Acidimicrobiales bacterium]
MKRLAATLSAVLISAVALLAGVAVPPATAQTADAVTVARGLIAAENAHNVAAAVDFFAPGAIVSLPTGALATRADITAWQRDLAAGNFHAETTAPVAVTPEVVTFSGTVALDLFRGLGIASLDSTWQLTVQLGKVTTFVFDFTPAATARLGAALAGAGAGAGGGTATPAAAGSPSAGGGTGTGTATAAPATAATRTLALTGTDVLVPSTAGAASILAGAVFWLDEGRAHDANLITKVRT